MSVEIDYPLGLTGRTITGAAYSDGGGDVVGTSLTFTENVHRLGYYVATATLAAGRYWISLSSDGSLFDSQWGIVDASGVVILNPGPGAILTAAQAATLPASGTVAVKSDVPTSIQNRQEMDANSTRLANLDVTVSSRLAGSLYVVPPSSSTIAAATAAVMFVDGSANPLKVNADHSVAAGAGTVVIDNFITIPAPVASASQLPGVITCLRGDTLQVALPALGDITARTKLLMTAKANVNDADDLSVFQVTESVGLTRLNGIDAVTAGSAGLTVSNATTGVVNLRIDATVTAALAVRDLVWDVQVYFPSGISTPISGVFSVVADVTQSVT